MSILKNITGHWSTLIGHAIYWDYYRDNYPEYHREQLERIERRSKPPLDYVEMVSKRDNITVEEPSKKLEEGMRKLRESMVISESPDSYYS